MGKSGRYRNPFGSADGTDNRTQWPMKIRILFGALTLLAVLGLAEASLRLAQTLHGPDAFRSNSETNAESPGALNFIAIGDSMTYGDGADRGEAYPIQFKTFLELFLPEVTADVDNIGWIGTSTSHGLKRLQRFLESNPNKRIDYAFILYGVNNRWNLNDATFWDWDESAKKENLAGFIASKFQLSKAVNLALEGGTSARAKNRNDYWSIHKLTGWSVFFDGFEDDLLARWIERDLEAMARMLRKREIEPIFLTYFEARFEHLNPLIIKTAVKLGARYIDLEKPARYYSMQKMYAADGFHFNAKGYQDIAARLALSFIKLLGEDEIRARFAKKKDSTSG